MQRLSRRAGGFQSRDVGFTVQTDIDCHHGEASFHDGQFGGYVTSGGYAHYSQQSVAMGYVLSVLVVADEAFEIEILGQLYTAQILTEPLHDPLGLRMRA